MKYITYIYIISYIFTTTGVMWGPITNSNSKFFCVKWHNLKIIFDIYKCCNENVFQLKKKNIETNF